MADSAPWKYGHALRDIRGDLSMEAAARKIGVGRQAWDAWERRGVRPRHENLKAIVEAFDVPPGLIGYEPPAGWVWVPEEQIAAVSKKLDRILEICEHEKHQ
jgi:transcriptional regulator with XRE-family HTH domain